MNACSNFIEHAWKKNICRDCFQRREDHSCQQVKQTISPAADPPPAKSEQVIRKNATAKIEITSNVTARQIPQQRTIVSDSKSTSIDQLLSDDTNVPVWVQIEGCEPEKVRINRSADIDDLKQKLFPEPNVKRTYRAYYKNEVLDADECVPLDAHRHQLLVLKKVLPSHSTKVSHSSAEVSGIDTRKLEPNNPAQSVGKKIPDVESLIDHHPTNLNEEKAEENNSGRQDVDFRKKLKEIIQESPDMVDEIFKSFSNDMNIIICGSPRVGKSTLINSICGREVAEAKEGPASVTHVIKCYTLEGHIDTGSKIIPYKYNFWDTPGFESWEKNNIRPILKKIIEKPGSKPVCMIFCASPGAFVDLTQLEWLLDLCIKEKHIFCALVCTNKYAGEEKSLNAVLGAYNNLLSKYVNEPPKVENDITIYGHVGLTTSVNSQPYKIGKEILPKSGVNELIYTIMELLADEEVLKFILAVIENKSFWTKFSEKISQGTSATTNVMKKVRKLFKRKSKSTNQK